MLLELVRTNEQFFADTCLQANRFQDVYLFQFSIVSLHNYTDQHISTVVFVTYKLIYGTSSFRFEDAALHASGEESSTLNLDKRFNCKRQYTYAICDMTQSSEIEDTREQGEDVSYEEYDDERIISNLCRSRQRHMSILTRFHADAPARREVSIRHFISRTRKFSSRSTFVPIRQTRKNIRTF